MVKKLVIHASFTYTDKATKQRARAFRGDTIDVGKEDAERGTKFGAFGTPADLVPKEPDEGVVDLAADEPPGTPIVPLVSRSAILEAVLRERLGLAADATEADVVAALDTAMAKAKEEPTPAEASAPPTPPTPVEPVIVNLPPTSEDDDGNADQAVPTEAEVEDEGLAVVAEQTPTVEPPPQSAVKARWEAHAVLMGMTEGEAKATSKQDLIAKYGGS